MKKRVISLMLAVAMLLSMASSLTVSVRAAPKTHYCFEGSALCEELPAAYRAMQVEDAENFFVTWINLYRSYDPESEEYDYDAANFRKRIENSLATTLAKGLDPEKITAQAFLSGFSSGSLSDYAFQEADLYDALFLSMLMKTAESAEIGDEIQDFCNDVMSCLETVVFLGEYSGTFGELIKSGGYSVETLVHLMQGNIIDGRVLTYYDGDSFTIVRNNSHFANVMRKVDIEFGLDKNTTGSVNISGLTVLLTLIQIVLEAFSEITEITVAICNCIRLYRKVGPTYAEVLRLMVQHTDNDNIRWAAAKYHFLINSNIWVDYVGMACVELVEGGVETLASVGEILAKVLVGAAFPTYGISLMLLGAMDVAFATSARVETSYALLCLQDIDEAMLATLTALDTSFKQAFDGKNDRQAAVYARQYVTASIMCLRMLQKEYEYCRQFFETIYQAGLVNTLKNCFPNAGKEALEGWESHIDSMQAALRLTEKNIFEEGSNIWKRYHDHVELIQGGMTVTYALNGGTGDFAPQHKAYNQPLVIRTGTPVKEGYVFDGWWPTIDGYGVNPVDFWYYKNENAISPDINPCYFAKEIVMKAQWVKSQDMIRYHANGGVGAPAAQENTGNALLSAQAPTRYGYIFLGWDENPGAKTPTYPAGAQNVLTKTGSVTLYALWKPVTFQVIFDANGGLFDDSGTERIFKPKDYSQPFVIDVAQPYGKEGYTFSGTWALTPEGGGEIYIHDTIVSDIGDDTTNDKVLYAVWTENPKPKPVVPGDINGDMLVNNLDLFALQKYLEGHGEAVVEGALDVNGDSAADQGDFTRLYQYLTGWDVEIYPEPGTISLMAELPPITVTQPRDNQWILYSDPPALEWEAVAGAAGYRISIRNLDTDELLMEQKWTAETSLSLNGKLDQAAAPYRIWIGAMPSKSADAGEALAEAILSVYTQPEAPEIQEETWEAVTHDSITLSMNITRNNGSAITDSGFYVVKNGLPTSEWVQYSFSDYGSYSATAGGYKEMTITGLMPDTSYLCYGYAVNGVGETITAKIKVTTAEYNCPHANGVYVLESPQAVSYINTGDSQQHQEIWYYDEYCVDCQAVVNEQAQSEIYYYDHDLVANVCTLCKYAAACPHSEVTKQYYTTTYQITDERVHQRNAFYHPVCDACGEITDPRTLFDTFEEPHTFRDHVCTGCGYAEAIALALSATVEQTTANPGDILSVTAKAVGGAGGYQFAFVLLKDGELVDRMSYSEQKRWSHTVTEYGAYQFVVYCMDSDGAVVTAESTIVQVCSATELSLCGSQTWAAPGETVTVSFSLTNNPGWKSLKFDFAYDETCLTLEQVSLGEGLSENHVLLSQGYDSPVTVNCFAVESSEAVCRANGNYITATFRVAEDAPEGYYPITLDYDPRDVFDASGTPLELVASNAYLAVKENVSDDEDDSNPPSGGSQELPGGYVVRLDRTSGTTAIVSADNKTDKTMIVTVIAAVYDARDRMISCCIEDRYWRAGSTVFMEVAFALDERAATVKVFLLESGTLIPLRESWKQGL